jgi:superfamily II DNA/RNA helicase
VSVSFADLGVPANVVASLADRGIDAPFPIQAATIPDGLAGRDLCGRAPTGSGKTIAFGIPLVVALTEGSSKPKRPRGLVLVPTRELASQVCHELQLLAKPRGPWVEAFYGGVGFDRQVSALKRGVDIAVCCPGRLGDLINQHIIKLDEVEFVVIDEADRMADMGFLPEVRQLLDQCRDDRQTVLFSATLDGDVDVLIKKYQRDPARHEFIADDEGGALAEHLFWQVDRMDRMKTAAAVVDKLGPTIVFCRTKRGADRIATQLESKGVRAAAIHGDRSQKQREKALFQFHKGQVEALVATDVAARGIHVDNVAGVIHFDPPADHKDYVHRSGRTARAGSTGVVVSLVPGELRRAVAEIQKRLGYPVGLTAANLAELDAHVSERAPAPRSEPRPARAERDGGRTARRERSAWDGPSDRASRSRTERSERSMPPAGPAGAPRADRDDRDGREGRDASAHDRAAVADRESSSRPYPVRRVDDDRPPLAEGQRRPSGASRRKAKREAAAEAFALDDGFLAEAEYDAATRKAKVIGPRGYLGNSGPPTGKPKGTKPKGKPKGAKAKTKGGAVTSGKPGTSTKGAKVAGGKPKTAPGKAGPKAGSTRSAKPKAGAARTGSGRPSSSHAAGASRGGAGSGRARATRG